MKNKMKKINLGILFLVISLVALIIIAGAEDNQIGKNGQDGGKSISSQKELEDKKAYADLVVPDASKLDEVSATVGSVTYAFDINNTDANDLNAYNVKVTNTTGGVLEVAMPDSFTIGSKQYKPVSLGDSKVSAFSSNNFNKYMNKLTLPTTLMQINDNALLNCDALAAIVIPEPVTKIGANAFKGCILIATVNIPNNVHTIGANAFQGCTALATVTLGTGVKTIGATAFDGAALTTLTINSDITAHNNNFANKTNIKTVTFGNTVTKIPDNLFKGSTGITALNLGAATSTLTTIGAHAFDGCTSIPSVAFTNNITSIGDYAFYNCSSIANNVTIPNLVSNLGIHAFENCVKLPWLSIGTTLTTIKDSTFKGCIALGTLGIGAGVKTIEQYAFSGCTRLGAVNTANVNVIKTHAFENCPALTLAIGPTLTTIEDFAFTNCTAIVNLTITNTVTTIGASAFKGCTGITTLVVGTAVQSIGADAFTGAPLTNLTIGSNIKNHNKNFANKQVVTLILENAVTEVFPEMFRDNTKLTTLYLGRDGNSNLQKIDNNAFSGCTTLVNVTVQNKVTTIGEDAFQGCKALANLVLGTSVTTLEEGAFEDTLLTTLTINSDIVNHNYNFAANSNIKTVYINNTVTKIPEDMFEYCTGLTTLYLGTVRAEGNSLLTSIGEHSFYGCTSLVSVAIPVRVTDIGDNAFYGCESMTSMSLGAAVARIGEFAFYGCIKLARVDIPASVRVIESSAFQECRLLATLNIAAGITKISDYAFYSCTVLPTVVLPNTIQTIGSNAFSACTALVNFTINGANALIEKNAFVGSPLTNLWINGNIPQHNNNFVGKTTIQNLYFANEVTTIYKGMFKNCTGIKLLQLGANASSLMASVEDEAFSGCTNLAGTVTLWAKVTKVGNYAFYKCENLQTITYTLGTENATIGNFAFSGCKKIVTVDFPNNYVSLGTSSFSDCSALINVTTRTGLHTIGVDAFKNTPVTTLSLVGDVTTHNNNFVNKESLVSVIVYQTCTTIPQGMFKGCPNLTTLNTQYATTLAKIEREAFKDCVKLTTSQSANWVVIPGVCKTIEDSAFSGCTGIVNLDLQSGILEIKQNAFYHCTKLANITIPNTTTKVYDHAFDGCEVVKTLNMQNALQEIGNYAFNGLKQLTAITFGTAVKKVGDYAFNDCDTVTTLTITDPITSIGANSFASCNALVTLVVGTGLKTIGNTAFADTPLATITFNGDITSHGNSFNNKATITTVTFGDGVTKIPDTLLKNDTGITSLQLGTIPTSTTQKLLVIGNEAFSGCNKIPSLKLPATVTTIGNYAFYNCALIAEYTSGSNITTIGNYAFAGCKKIPTANIVIKVTSIGEKAFYDCDTLATVVIPDRVKTIGPGAFAECDNLRTVTIGSDVEQLGVNAFQNDHLTNVTIKGDLQNHNNNFKGRAELETVAFANSVTTIYPSMFEGCTALSNLKIGQKVTTIGEKAFYNCPALLTGDLSYIDSITNEKITSVGYNALRFDPMSEQSKVKPSVTVEQTAEWAKQDEGIAKVNLKVTGKNVNNNSQKDYVIIADVAINTSLDAQKKILKGVLDKIKADNAANKVSLITITGATNPVIQTWLKLDDAPGGKQNYTLLTEKINGLTARGAVQNNDYVKAVREALKLINGRNDHNLCYSIFVGGNITTENQNSTVSFGNLLHGSVEEAWAVSINKANNNDVKCMASKNENYFDVSNNADAIVTSLGQSMTNASTVSANNAKITEAIKRDKWDFYNADGSNPTYTWSQGLQINKAGGLTDENATEVITTNNTGILTNAVEYHFYIKLKDQYIFTTAEHDISNSIKANYVVTTGGLRGQTDEVSNTNVLKLSTVSTSVLVKITLKDSKTQGLLQGAEFKVYKSEDKDRIESAQAVATLVNAGDGVYQLASESIASQPTNDFVIVQTVAPNYHIKSTNKIEFTKSEPKTKEVAVTNDPFKAKVEVNLVDSVSKTPLEGAEFTVYEWKNDSSDYAELQKDGGQVVKLTYNNGTHKYESEDLFASNENQGKFRIKETKEPEGYYNFCEGGKIKENDITLTEPLNGTTIAIKNNGTEYTNEKIVGKITVTNKDSIREGTEPQGDAKLDGAEYGLYAKERIANAGGQQTYEADTEVTRKTMTGNKLEFTDLGKGKYYVKQISAPKGYKDNATQHDVTIEPDQPIADQHDVIAKTLDLTEEIKDRALKISYIKGQDIGELSLEGVKFKIYLISNLSKVKNGNINAQDDGNYNIKDFDNYDFESETTALTYSSDHKEGQETGELSTLADGTLTTPKLPYGKYIVVQTECPDDQLKVSPFIINIDEDNDTPLDKTITVGDEFEAFVKVTVKDKTTNQTIVNKEAKYRIKNTDTQSYVEQQNLGTAENPYTTANNGYFKTPLKLPKGNYELEEIQAPNGYVAQGHEATISEGQVSEQHSDKVTFKVSMDSEPVNEDGSYVINVDQLKEQVLGELKLTVKGNNKESGQVALSGAQFEVHAKEDIKSQDGQETVKHHQDDLIETITSNGEGIAYLDNLLIGKYYVKQISTFGGYDIDQTQQDFEIAYADQNTPTVVKEVNFVNEESVFEAFVKVTVKDKTTEQPILNKEAKFRIKDTVKDSYVEQFSGGVNYGTVENPYTTDSNGTFKTPLKVTAGNYELEQVQAPNGYVLQGQEATRSEGTETPNASQKVTFTVSMESDPQSEGDDYVINVEQLNEQVLGELKLTVKGKASEEEQVPLNTAQFEVYAKEDIKSQDGQNTTKYAAGTKVDDITSNEEGIAYLDNLPIGKYYVKQVSTYSGYEIDTTQKDFEITYTDQNTPTVVKEVNFLNEKSIFEAFVKVTVKDKTTKQPILNKTAKYRIKDVSKGSYVEQLSGDITYGTVDNPFTTNNQGYFETPLKLTAGTYELEEIQAPDGYVLQGKEATRQEGNETPNPSQKVSIVVSESTPHDQKGGTEDYVINVEQQKEQVLGELKITVKGNDNDQKPINGAKFEVYAKEDIKNQDGQNTVKYNAGTKVSDITSNEDGIAYLENLPVGKYYVKQVSSSIGYEMDEDQKDFEIQYVDQNTATVVTEVEYLNEKTEVIIPDHGISVEITADKTVYKPGEKIAYKVKVTNTGDVDVKDTIVKASLINGEFEDPSLDNVTKENEKQIKITTLGSKQDITLTFKTQISSLDEGQHTTRITLKIECTGTVTLPDADNIPNTKEEEVSASATKDVIISDQKIVAEVKDEETKEPIEGVEIGLFTGEQIDEKEQDTLIGSQTTSEHGIVSFDMTDLTQGRYYIKETSTPKGYLSNDQQEEIVVTEQRDDIEVVEFLNTITKVKIHRVDENGGFLTGADLQVLEDASEFTHWTSEDGEYILKGLEVGKVYTLKETKAPAGYLKAEEIKFSVNEEGNTILKPNETDEQVEYIEIKSEKTVVKFSLKDSKGSFISGSQLQILDGDQQKAEWTTGDDLHTVEKLEAGKVYTLNQKTKVSGYTTGKDIKFKVGEDGKTYLVGTEGRENEVSSVDMIIDKTKVSISVLDRETQSVVEGLKVRIVNGQGSDQYSYTTQGATTLIEGLPIGEYSVIVTDESDEPTYEEARDTLTVKDTASSQSKTIYVDKVKVSNLLLGDINENDKLDVNDIVKMQRHIAASTNETVKAKHPVWILTGKKLILADVNEDGNINSIDMILLMRHVAAQESASVELKHPNWLMGQ